MQPNSKTIREGGAPAGDHLGGRGAASEVLQINSSESQIQSQLGDSSAQIPGVLDPPVLNDSAAPPVLCDVPTSLSFVRQTPSNGQIPDATNSSSIVSATNQEPVLTTARAYDGPAISSRQPLNELCFSELTATELAAKLSENMQTFPTAVWIKEDVNGMAVLMAIDPSDFPNFLESTCGISSGFAKARIFANIVALMALDSTISKRIDAWDNARKYFIEKIHRVNLPDKLGNTFLSPIGKLPLLATPSIACSTLSGNPKSAPTPAFLSQIPSRSSLMDDTMLFQDATDESSNGRVSLSGGSSAPSSASAAVLGGNIAITINQPSILPKYEILENVKDAEPFYIWLRKTRKENLIADEADRKPFRNLLSQDAKYEVVRFINSTKKDDPTNAKLLFDDLAPFPKKWASVTDTLVLRVLFRLNGPINVEEARDRLQKYPFFFPDATTPQNKFTPKLRSWCNIFTQMVQDLEYNCSQWPQGEDLTPQMLKDAFTECFQNKETTLGADGTTIVPKSSNLYYIRNFLKDNKKLTLEEIIDKLVAKFEARDLAIRHNKTSGYTVVPWKTKDAKNKQKRQVNQVVSVAAADTAPRKFRADSKPKTNNPRCNNCGSKGHVCSERTCFFWGHPKAKGPHGSWPEGTPSIDLDKDEFKAWKIVRHEIFYSYPENHRKANPKPPA